ncbi:MFS transporter [Paraburkholderia sp. BR10936]|uniref:MFS transporter n=1 Tax=Paraburkholderia sp. BR10936 TaxID=3236993 RepID=UPI0034D248CE
MSQNLQNLSGVETLNAGGHAQARTFAQSLCAMLGLSSVVMMVAIDQTVVGTALPTIVADLKGFDLYAWVATAYLLTSVITVPIFGRLGDWFGRKPLIIAAIVLFTGASALCGAAGSMATLIAYRALQGVGGGMLVGTCFASIPDLFPDPLVRLRWQVLFSSAFGVANAIGPSLGGFLSQHYGWRSAFLANIPVGLVSLCLTSGFLPHIRHVHLGKLNPDWRGALWIALTLGASQLLVESVGRHGIDLTACIQAAVFVAGLALLVREERHAPQAILPSALLRDRVIVVLLVLSLLMGVAMFALLFYVPLLLQGALGLGAEQAGVAVTPLVVCITVGTIANTRIVTRIANPNLLLYAGFALLAASCAGIACVPVRDGGLALPAAMLIGGVGIGFVMPNLTVFAQQVAGKQQLGIATAMIQSARMVGGILGTAVAGAIVHTRYVSGLESRLAARGASLSGPFAALRIWRCCRVSMLGLSAPRPVPGTGTVEEAVAQDHAFQRDRARDAIFVGTNDPRTITNLAGRVVAERGCLVGQRALRGFEVEAT